MLIVYMYLRVCEKSIWLTWTKPHIKLTSHWRKNWYILRNLWVLLLDVPYRLIREDGVLQWHQTLGACAFGKWWHPISRSDMSHRVCCTTTVMASNSCSRITLYSDSLKIKLKDKLFSVSCHSFNSLLLCQIPNLFGQAGVRNMGWKVKQIKDSQVWWTMYIYCY